MVRRSAGPVGSKVLRLVFAGRMDTLFIRNEAEI